jgi:hypothetical protein
VIVVLDTQIFVYDAHLLRKELGRQLLVLLQARNGRLFLPEILRIEYFKQTRKAVHDKQRNVAANANEVLSLVGRSIAYDVLTDEIIDQATTERFDALDDIIQRGPTRADLNALASDRVVTDRLPAPKGQFKDCMIWEAILTLTDADVYFVTRDNGFYEEGEFSDTLVAEARERGVRLHAFRKLELLLQLLQKRELDRAPAAAAAKVQNPEEPIPAEPIQAAAAALPTEAQPVPEQELDNALQQLQAQFREIDTKVLGIIAYLETGTKDQIFDLLERAGIDREMARVSAERLSHGIVRDTGNHYILENRTLARAASARLDEVVSRLLGEGKGNG